MRVYFTVDTETSMGGAWRNPAARPLPLERSIFGKMDSKYYGIPLLMDILEEYGFRGTFFTEMFCSRILGLGEVERVLTYIHNRGHDAQLHLHPAYRYYHHWLQGGARREQDLMCDLPATEQDELIGEGIDIFRRLTGRAPRAYRAGCYGASEVTLAALRRHGVTIDSSYNLACLDVTCKFRSRPLNGPRRMEGLQEFPVTNFRVALQSGYKPLEVGAVSVAEILATIDSLRAAGCRDVVLSLHSFSFLKNLEHRNEPCRPDRIVIQRFRTLCAALARIRGEVEVPLIGEANLPEQPLGSDHIPYIGWRRPLLRKIVQGVNRFPWI